MTPEEALRILRLAKALSPAQALDEYTPEAWAMVLRNTRYTDAEEALIELGGEQEWIHVSHIKARVKRIRSARLAEFGPLPEPPQELNANPAAYTAWLNETRQRICDGEHVEVPTLPPVDPEHGKRMAALIRGGGEGAPRPEGLR